MEKDKKIIKKDNIKTKPKKKIIGIIIAIIIIIFIILIAFSGSSSISSLQIKDNTNYVGSNIGKYEVGTYNPKTLTTDDLYNFYKVNVEQGQDDILKDKGVSYIILKDKDNPSEGYYFTQGYFTKCQITNDDMMDNPTKTWFYSSNKNSFEENDG